MSSHTRSFQLLNITVEPATRLIIQLDLGKIGGPSIPVEVINGRHPGPVLCLTAAIHGNELNGIEIIRKAIEKIDPGLFSGVIVAIPVVNLEGYCNQTRHICEQSDLNRCFPGEPGGSYAEQVAHTLFSDIISVCDAVIDIHTGSAGRENLPQLRVDLSVRKNADLSAGFNHLSVIQSNPPQGSLREASTLAGMPAIVMEIGGSQALEPDMVLLGVKALQSLFGSIRMLELPISKPEAQHIYYGGGWIRSEIEGIFIARAALGETVEADQIVAEIINPLSSICYNVTSPIHCTILGRSHNQFLKAGSGLFRVGVES